MRGAGLLLISACVAPTPPTGLPSPASAARELEQAPAAELRVNGQVLFRNKMYSLVDTRQAAALGKALSKLDGRLRIEARRGTPVEHVRRLIAVLEAGGMDDYRLDLGR